VVLASDVDNPLLGTGGAASVYAPQKGASEQQVAELESALRHWAELLGAATGTDLEDAAGAGAAGGVGYAALAVLGAERRSGIDVVLDLVGFEDLLSGAGLVITGEGSLDEQSLHGKAPVGVAAAAARRGVETIAVAGRCSLSTEQLRSAGLLAAYTLESLEADRAISLRDAGRLIEELTARRIVPDWLA
jgi:glycerate kinase